MLQVQLFASPGPRLVTDLALEIYFHFFAVKTVQAARALKRQRLKAEAINSDLSQRQRENIMAAFRKGMIKVLVVCVFFPSY